MTQTSQNSALRRRCEQIAVDLSAYVDGELGTEEFTRQRCRVEAHLEACSDCRELARDWSGVVEVLAVPDVPDRPWFAAEFRRRLVSEERKHTDRLRWLGLRLIPVAVTVLGLVLGVLVRFELERDRVSETLVERILRIQDVEASTLASTPVIAEGDRRSDGFDLDELLISAGGVDSSRDTGTPTNAVVSGVVPSEDAVPSEDMEPNLFARLEKDR